MKLQSASFFWRNDKPDGLGITFGPDGFSPEELTEMFTGRYAREYISASDANLGSAIVATYLDQLKAIAVQARLKPLPMQTALIAALNIMYLSERGFIPNDEFNGPVFVQVE